MPGRYRARALAWLVLAALAVGCARDEGYGSRSAEEWAARLDTASDPQHRIEAANAFLRSPPRTYANVHALLTAAATDEEGIVRSMSRAALQHLQENATSALIRSLDDTSALVRRRAAEAIGRMPRASPKAVGPLVEHLSDPDDSVRVLSMLALGGMGGFAYDARDTVKALATHPGPLRPAALEALPSVDPETHTFIELYRAAASDTSEKVRLSAIRNLWAGARSREHDFVAILSAALADPSDSVRMASLEMLQQMGPSARAALPALSQLEKERPTEDIAHLLRKAISAIRGSTPPT